MTYGVAESMEAFPFFLPEQALFFAPAIVTESLRSSGEFLRGHGAEMTSVLMQSLAEFLEDPYGFSIAGCGRFCAQVTNAVFESAAGHHEYNYGNACMRVDFLTVQDSRTGSENVRQVMWQSCSAIWWFPPTMPPQRLQTMSASHRKHTLTHV